MKQKLLFLIFTAFLLTFSINSLNANNKNNAEKKFLAPKLNNSYMIPDVAAPNMAVYLEIIGPTSGNGIFGTDGRSLNNPGDDIRVKADGTTGDDKVTFGPCVVSWDGRMISTQVFVHPDVEPNTWDPKTLNPEFKIPVIAEINGTEYFIDTLYIVQPFQFGDLGQSTQTVLGAGVLGYRSPRGAMVVDRMNLTPRVGNKRYTISVEDCDPNTPGNQGWLPFVLLSKGPIEGENQVVISVDGGEISSRAQNAGPGGGGGGGKFIDHLTNFNGGEDGGNGFVSGGFGGRNDLFGGGNLRSYGESTAENGVGINGVSPPQHIVSWEASGGATGHPFGLSGEYAQTNDDVSRNGQFGGGAGFLRHWPGGMGGYASAPTTAANGRNNIDGKVHGNEMAIPIAGGSGGAGGNPQGPVFSPNVEAGNGGGGGGAVRIYGMEISGVSVSSKGGNGSNGWDGANGGPGSGGHIGVFSKYFNDSDLNVEGGSTSKNGQQYRGGAGRLTYSARNDAIVRLPGEASFFRYASSDSSNFVKTRVFNITGTKDNGALLEIYIKPESGEWAQWGFIDGFFSTWNMRIELPTDELYFLTVMQNIENPSSDDYLYEPDWVLSQAAANIFILDLEPNIEPENNVITPDAQELEITLTDCGGDIEYLFEHWVWNEGEGILNLDFANATITGNGYELVSPLDFVTLDGINILDPTDEMDSTLITVRFTKPFLGDSPFNGQLSVPTNDPDTPDYILNFTVNLEQYSLTKHPINDFTQEIDTLDLGKICRNEQIIGQFSIRNTSNIQNYEIEEPTFQDGTGFTIINYGPILGGDSDITIQFEDTGFAPTQNIINDRIYFYAVGCDLPIDSLEVKVELGESEFTIVTQTAFPLTIVDQTSTSTIILENTGDLPIQVRDEQFFIVPNPFSIIQTDPVLPALIQPGEFLTLTVEFAPTATGNYNETMRVITEAGVTNCLADITVALNANAAEVAVEYEEFYDLGVIAWCDSRDTSIVIRNPAPDASGVEFSITSEPSLSGPNADEFEIIRGPNRNIPILLTAQDGVTYVVRFTPNNNTSGQRTAYLTVETDVPGQELIEIELTVFVQGFDVTVAPAQFNNQINIFAGIPEQRQVVVTNNGSLDVTISEVLAPNPPFTVTNISNNVVPANGGTATIEFEIYTTQVGPLSGQITILFDEPCDDEIVIPFSGRSNGAEIAFSDNPLDLGRIPICDVASGTFTMSNIGDAPFQFVSARLDGANAQYFALDPDVFTEEQTIWHPGFGEVPTSLDFRVDFLGGVPADGVYEVEVIFDVVFNGMPEERRITVTIEVESGDITIIDNPVDFGGIVINNTDSRDVTITNDGPWVMEITGFTLPNNIPGIYTVTPNIDGTTLAVGESVTFTITFAPVDELNYGDLIVLDYTLAGCDFSDNILINAVGSKAKELLIWIPDLEPTTPDLDNYRIPIYGRVVEPDEPLENFTIDSINISFNRSLFWQREVVGGEIIDEYAAGNTRFLTISLDNVNMTTTESLIGEIVGYTMLGNVTTSAINIDNIYYSDVISVTGITSENGSMTIEICEEGGDRLLERVSPQPGIVINPNPSNGKISVNLDIHDSGNYSLSLIDVKGSVYFEDELRVEESGYQNKLNLNVDLPSGVYNFILSNGKEVFMEKVIVIN